MKKLLFALGVGVLFLSGCEFSLYPPSFFNKILATKTNSSYYEKKVRFLVSQLVSQMTATNKVAVMDLVDRDGRIPVLGRYLSMKIVNNISKHQFFKLTQRGDLINALKRLNGDFDNFDASLLQELGKALHVEAIITGRIIDLGTNLDINLNSINVKTGEIIASASVPIARSNFAMEMLRKY